jgi:hypothetical protein
MGEVRNRVAESISRKYSNQKNSAASKLMQKEWCKSGPDQNDFRVKSDIQNSTHKRSKTNGKETGKSDENTKDTNQNKNKRAFKRSETSVRSLDFFGPGLDQYLSLQTLLGALRSCYQWLRKCSPTMKFALLLAGIAALHLFYTSEQDPPARVYQQQRASHAPNSRGRASRLAAVPLGSDDSGVRTGKVWMQEDPLDVLVHTLGATMKSHGLELSEAIVDQYSQV